MSETAVCPRCTRRLPPAARFCPRCGRVLAQRASGAEHSLPYAAPPAPLPPKARTIWHEPAWVRFGGVTTATIGGGLIISGNPILALLGFVLLIIGLIAVIVALFA